MATTRQANTVKSISILGCGWLGLPLATRLVEAGWTVRGSTTSLEKLKTLENAGITPFRVVLDGQDSLLPLAFFDAEVLFLNVPPQRRAPNVQARVQDQIQRVMQAAARGGVTWIVFASSTSVYANLNREVTEADARTGTPERTSGLALRAAEDTLEQAPFDVTILRYAGLYGPERFPGRFMAGKTGVDGADAPVNLVHLDDAVGVAEAVLAQNVRNEVFNVCADTHPTRQRLYTQAAESLGLEPPQFSDEPKPFKIVGNAHLKARLGYVFQHPDPVADVRRT